jgi:hypothetical protein
MRPIFCRVKYRRVRFKDRKKDAKKYECRNKNKKEDE